MAELEKSTVDNIFTPLLDTHLTALLSGIDIPSFSRIPPFRFSKTAVPHISSIELVNADDFAHLYDPLYVENFPKRAERESSDLIITRLRAQFAGQRTGLAPYRIVGLRATAYPPTDSQIADGTASPDPTVKANDEMTTNETTLRSTTESDSPINSQSSRLQSEHSVVIGAAQFSVLFLPPDRTHAVPYLQYLYIHPAFRRKDMAEVLHTFVLAVAEADGNMAAAATVAAATASSAPTPQPLISTHLPQQSSTQPMTVPFTLFETEPPGHGEDETSRAYAKMRAGIHARAGGIALVLRKRHSGRILSAHVQPGLEGDDQPLTLVWVVRPSPKLIRDSKGQRGLLAGINNGNEGDGSGQAEEIARLGSSLIRAYYQSLRDEGFPEENIALAERIVAERVEGSVFELMPLEEILPFTAEDGGVN